jgi:5-methyltetrahydrofolate--homocysteine methyltransferase
MIREEFGCNTVCGASNISFGLPNRHLIDSVFVPMAMAAGMTCAITNPLQKAIRNAIYAADALMGHDESCMRYLAAMREADASAGGAVSTSAAGALLFEIGKGGLDIAAN